ncbi:LCP family protein [Streptomyces sp. MP131-18]|uniref:LCP family protein n=1 Tax=Streptomyces sp. MP131-18 TaxID=1857892 RepID=UPI00097BAF27|nr:LCP family protein [Streptomyces sp. MP131-18]
MNDRHDPYGQPYGYDEYGRPLYRTAQQQPPAPQEYDYGTGEQPPVWDTGTQAPQSPHAPVPGAYDYGTGQQPPVWDGYQGGGYEGYGGYDGYGRPQDTGPQPPVTETFDYGRDQSHGHDQTYGQGWAGVPGHHHDGGTGEQPPVPPAEPGPPPAVDEPPAVAVPQQRRPPADDFGADYGTEQFAFVDEQDDDSEDVIDWLKFSESRTERREEAKRRGRGRRRLLIIVLVLAVLGGTAFLWATDRLPGVPGPDSGDEATAGAEVRDVIVVHLRQTDSDETATALLIANETAGTGTTLLLPNELAVTPDGGATTLGQAVTEEAAGSVRDSLGTLLGADIKGTWRLDTPYLEILVDLVGGITVTTDTEVPGGEEDEGPLVEQGEDVLMDGRDAIAYASHRGDGEPQTAQLARFGQVLHAVLLKLPSNESGATQVVESLTQITDPSLTEEELGISLARLAGYAQDGGHDTESLPVESGGTISDETADGLVADVLGGTVSNTEAGAVPRIGIRDASGSEDAAETARIALVNGGFTVADSRPGNEQAAESSVTYADEAHQATAREVAATLGLPDDVVTQGDAAGNADVTIVLGGDYGQ